MNQEKSLLTETIVIGQELFTDRNALYNIHRHFTENAPSKYYDNNVIEVENHYTKRRYSIRGEEILDVVQQKQLRYLIEDGSSIIMEYNEHDDFISFKLFILGGTLKTTLEKSVDIRAKLMDIITQY